MCSEVGFVMIEDYMREGLGKDKVVRMLLEYIVIISVLGFDE